MQTKPTQASLAHIRARLAENEKAIAATTAATLFANPNHVRSTALNSAAIMAEILDMIEGLCTYVEGVANE